MAKRLGPQLFRSITAIFIAVAAINGGCAPRAEYVPKKNVDFLAELQGVTTQPATTQSTITLTPPVGPSATRPAQRMFDEFNGATTFDLTDAYLCELACFVADSSDSSSVQTTFEHWGFKEATPFFSRQAGAYAWIFTNRKIVLVVFCNTDFGSSVDWSSNLETDLVKGDPELGEKELVHAGFLDAVRRINFKSLERQIRLSAKLDGDGDATKPIWLTGHSRGGALAAITAAALLHSERSIELAGIYTFGQPPFGNEALAKRLSEQVSNYHRIVNRRDPIPLILGKPPWSDFVHGGTEHHLDGKFAQEMPAGEDWWMGDAVDHLHPSYMASIYRSLKMEMDANRLKKWDAPAPGSIAKNR